MPPVARQPIFKSNKWCLANPSRPNNCCHSKNIAQRINKSSRLVNFNCLFSSYLWFPTAERIRKPACQKTNRSLPNRTDSQQALIMLEKIRKNVKFFWNLLFNQVQRIFSEHAIGHHDFQESPHSATHLAIATTALGETANHRKPACLRQQYGYCIHFHFFVKF